MECSGADTRWSTGCERLDGAAGYFGQVALEWLDSWRCESRKRGVICRCSEMDRYDQRLPIGEDSNVESAFFSETLKFANSCYARSEGIRSPDAKPPKSVIAAVEAYAKAVNSRKEDAVQNCLVELETAIRVWVQERS